MLTDISAKYGFLKVKAFTPATTLLLNSIIVEKNGPDGDYGTRGSPVELTHILVLLEKILKEHGVSVGFIGYDLAEALEERLAECAKVFSWEEGHYTDLVNEIARYSEDTIVESYVVDLARLFDTHGDIHFYENCTIWASPSEHSINTYEDVGGVLSINAKNIKHAESLAVIASYWQAVDRFAEQGDVMAIVGLFLSQQKTFLLSIRDDDLRLSVAKELQALWDTPHEMTRSWISDISGDSTAAE